MYLRWTTSVSSTNSNNRDFQLDDIVITYTTSGTPVVETPIIYPNGGEFYPTTQSISISCATQDATIRYTLDGNDPTTSSEVYSEPFTLTATTTVKAKAFKDGMDPSEIASATFTKATVMTVAQAIAATPTTGESDFVYVHGIVSEIVEEYNSQYHNISYNISDDGTTTSAQLEAFRGKNINNTNFTSNQDILPGDIVTIYGKLTLYGETYELAAGNYLVEHTPHTAVQYDLTVSSLSTNVNAIYVFNAEDETNPLITDGHAGTVQVYDGTSIIVSPDIADGYVLETLIVDGNNVTSQVAGGAYTFTMPTHAVTISATAMVAPTPVTYTLATSIVSGKTYIISDGVDRAMGAQSGNFRSAAAVTIDNDVATVSSTEVYEFVITGTEADGYTIYDAKDEGYLYASSSSSNNIGTRDENSDDNSMWTIKFDENSGVTITAKGTNTRNIIRYNYNNGNDRFSCYASSSSLTDPLYLYVKNEPVTTTYTLSITAADFTSNPATGYYFIASPVSENIAPSETNGITSGNYDLYFWDEPAHTWRNYKQNSAGTNTNAGFAIENGKGYLYANETSTTITFTGTPLTETSKAITLSKKNMTTTHGAWNLIGNPFTEAAYLTDANGKNRAYYIMKGDGSDVIAAEPGDPVAKMNGIFVIADVDNEVVTFSTNAPTNNGKFLALNINQNRGDIIDRAIVNFNEGSELPKLQLFESTKLYIKQNDEDYAVVNGQNQGTLPINFKATANGTYTLNIDTENVEFSTLILHDNLTGEDINLISRATYSFDATTDDEETRFTLVYSKDGEGTTETLTFYDGDTSSSYVPVYGFYADAYQKVEFIMPAEDLYALTGATINKMTWYLTTPAEVAWGGNFKIYLMETEATTPANYADLTNATLVYDGPLDGTGETLEINFATGFLYEGDNLLVAVHQTETGTYKSATFAGSAVTGAALQGYSYNNLDQVNQAVRDFLPKTTFEFTPGSGAIYYKPKQLQASEIGITSAVLTWEAGDDETSWGVEYKKVTEDTWTDAGTVDQLTITLDNLEAGTEYEAHVKSIYTDGESGWTTIAFATEACEETDKGEVAYTLTDTYGDGWNNNKLRIFLSGTDIMIAELTLTTGSELEGVVKLCYDTDYDLVWVAGNYAYETGFVLTAPDGTIIYEYHGTGSSSGGTTPTPGVLTTFQIHNGFTKTIEAYTDNSGYYLIASPVGNVLASEVTNMVDGNYDLYMFDQTGNDEGKQWLNYKASAFSYLEVGMGYLYASESDVTLTFSGTPISSDDDYAVEVNYNASSDFPGLNLLGNPFADEAYLVNAEGNGLAYHRLNPANNTYVTVDDNSAIPMMEGVFYEAGENDVVVYFSATAPATSKSNLNITVSQGRGMVDNAIVRFGEGNTLRKISLRDNSTKVYIPQNGSEYALVNANEFGEMPVNFKAESNGTYTMSFSNQNVEFGYLHLIDNLTGADVDLLANPSYSFEAKVSDYASRFKLVFATGNDDSSSDFAFVSNDEIIVNGEGMLQVIDMTGRIISTSQVNGMSSIKLNAAAGVYVLRLNDKTQKIVIR
ncbi:MAG: chitobiase/beta-hexosaminidase C-terminal domain-containing protein [Bacteroidales bacterium]|nr:chitobiase/beta-hexosaminidase C-terminal domain-containing protein [Bacteroidales bacterium]